MIINAIFLQSTPLRCLGDLVIGGGVQGLQNKRKQSLDISETFETLTQIKDLVRYVCVWTKGSLHAILVWCQVNSRNFANTSPD